MHVVQNNLTRAPRRCDQCNECTPASTMESHISVAKHTTDTTNAQSQSINTSHSVNEVSSRSHQSSDSSEIAVKYSEQKDAQHDVVYQAQIIQNAANQKPVRERHLKYWKYIAILGIILFFPTGVYSFYLACKLSEDYYLGITKGDMTACINRQHKLERWLILTFSFCLFAVVLGLALTAGVKTGHSLHRGRLL